jgi:TolB-like protein
MKNFILATALFAVMAMAAFGQNAGLPRLAVAEFSTNSNTEKTQRDSITVRNLVESQMVAVGKYQVISRAEIDLLLKNQQIQISSISSAENIKKLQLQNISYIVTGSVDAMDSSYAITVKILDVSTGRFSHSADAFMGGEASALYTGIRSLVGTFLAGMTASGGQVVQTEQPVAPIAPNRNSGQVYKIGDLGPAGGLVFYDKGVFSNGWRYLEAAPVETEFTAPWGAFQKNVSGTGTAVGGGKRNTQLIIDRLKQLGESGNAAQLCVSLDFDGYKDWFLPCKDELNLMYRNLKSKGLGGFSSDWYWSSSETHSMAAWVQKFSNGEQYSYHDGGNKPFTFFVRAVRAF